MTILTDIPGSLRRPGAFHQFKFLASGQQLVPLPLRVVIVAEKSAAGTAAAETPVQIFDEDDGDSKLGKGSPAALMARKALEQAKLGGRGSPQIWACPLTPVGTAATYTITVTGPATSAGDLVFTLAGRTISVGVSSGDSATAIAAAIEAKLDELAAKLPVTASVAGAVVTLTFVTAGVNGNDVERTTVKTPTGVTLAHANPTPGAGTVNVANALNALYNQRYHAIALSTHVVGDAATILTDAALATGYNQKNYRFYFLGERGSLGTAQTLQAAHNDYRVHVISCEAIGSLPGELAVSGAVAWMSREEPNANMDGERLALPPPPAASAYTATEVESALAGGVTPLTPDGSFVKIERLVTTQITVNGAPFEPLRDSAFPRTAFFMAEQIDIGFLTGFRQQVLSDSPENDVTQRVRDMVIEKHRAAQRAGYIRDVDDFLEQIQVEISPDVAGRLVVSDPFRVAGPLHQGAFVHTMYL